jgi:galactokinase/mevalonate kinase-like predicted kinase
LTAAPARAVCVSAPARANLIGNPSDLYGGAVLACSVPLRARVELEPAGALELVSGGVSLRVASDADLELRGDVFDVARAVLRAVGRVEPCCIRFETEIPMQSGLGGSTALQVALLRALRAWRGERRAGLHELAELARAIERRVMGVRCGYVDQYMCAFGGLRYVDLRGKEHETPEDTHPFATVEELPVPDAGLPFVLAFTGVRHHSGRVHAPIRERWERGEPDVVAACARMTAIGREGKRAFLLGDLARFGALMNENHALVRALGGSGEANERLIGAALGAGAAGAKLAGAGHGGTIAALWLGPDPAPLERALRAAGAAALFRCEPVPGVRVEDPAAGARPGSAS